MRFALAVESCYYEEKGSTEDFVFCLDLSDNTLKNIDEYSKKHGGGVYIENLDNSFSRRDSFDYNLYAYDDKKVELIMIRGIKRKNSFNLSVYTRENSKLNIKELYKYLSSLKSYSFGTKSMIKIKEFDDFEDLENLVNSLSNNDLAKRILDEDYCINYASRVETHFNLK